MTYDLAEVDEGTVVTFIHEDPREADAVVNDFDEDSPVLMARRTVAESLVNE